MRDRQRHVADSIRFRASSWTQQRFWRSFGAAKIACAKRRVKGTEGHRLGVLDFVSGVSSVISGRLRSWAVDLLTR